MVEINGRANIKLYNQDCMPALEDMEENEYSLAITDPPYGGGNNEDWEGKDRSRFDGRFDKYKIERTGGDWAEKYGKEINHWDTPPSDEYFEQLFKISKNQIIWGGNYYELPPNRCFLIWRKLTISEDFSMAMCEYAWSSFDDNAKWIEIAPQNSNRFHPTQKPVKLYKWLLKNYAEEGDKILDTHLGSMSIAIACWDMGYDLVGYEIDEDYFEKGVKRVKQHTNQMKLF